MNRDLYDLVRLVHGLAAEDDERTRLAQRRRPLLTHYDGRPCGCPDTPEPETP